MWRWILSFVSVAIAARAADAAQYFVANSGSNSAAGTAEAPWQTLQFAANAVAPGDRVTVRAGTYTGFYLDTSGTAAASGDGRRIQVNGFWPVTDAATVYGRISKRQSLQAPIAYTNEATMNADGFVPLIRSTRYSRAKIRIPAETVWTYASGVRPLAQPDGEV